MPVTTFCHLFAVKVVEALQCYDNKNPKELLLNDQLRAAKNVIVAEFLIVTGYLAGMGNIY